MKVMPSLFPRISFRLTARRVVFTCALLASLAGPSTPAFATRPFAPARLEAVVQGGWIGVADKEPPDAFAGVEVRLNRTWFGLRPWAGVTVVDSGTWFAGGGVTYDLHLSPKYRLTLGTGPFYYRRRDTRDLGFDLEFYSFAELTRSFRPGHRAGVRVGHLSNAGLGRVNPGAETIAFVVALPLPRAASASL